MKKLTVIFTIVLLAGIIAAPILAQEELSQTFVAKDNSFSFEYPGTWKSADSVWTDSHTIYIVTLRAPQTPTTMIFVAYGPAKAIFTPGSPGQNLDPDAIGGKSTVKVGDRQATNAQKFDASTGLEEYVVAFDSSNLGIVAWFSTAETAKQLEPTMLAIVATLTESASSSGVGTQAATTAATGQTQVKSLQPITAANAAQVTQLTSFSGSTATAQVLKIAFSPDGKTIAAASEDKGVHLIDVATGSAVKVLQGHTGSVISVSFSPDGKLIASGGGYGDDTTVRLWDAATGNLIKTFQDGSEGEDDFIAFSPDGKTLVDAAGTQILRWDVASGKPLASLKAGSNFYASSVAFSPDGKMLAATSNTEQAIQLWTVATGKLQATLKGAANLERISSVAFSPDGNTLASALDDYTVRLWDVTTGKLLTSFKGHSLPVNAVAFSPNGTVLASGGVDGTVRLWEVPSGKLLATLQRKQKFDLTGVYSIIFSPDGTVVASAGSSETIELWGIAAS